MPKNSPENGEKKLQKQPLLQDGLYPLVERPGYYLSIKKNELPRFWSDWDFQGKIDKNYRHEIFPCVVTSKYRYPRLNLRVGMGKSKSVNVHVLVSEVMFSCKCPKGLETRHWDGDNCNFRPNNLFRGTHYQNGQDTIRHGRSNRGIKNAQSVLNPKIILKIRKYSAEGFMPAQIGRILGIKRTTVSNVVHKRNWGFV